MIPSHKRPEAPERPITFRAAEGLGAFQLAELWGQPHGLAHQRADGVRRAG
jgi:hypothetical protein